MGTQPRGVPCRTMHSIMTALITESSWIVLTYFKWFCKYQQRVYGLLRNRQALDVQAHSYQTTLATRWQCCLLFAAHLVRSPTSFLLLFCTFQGGARRTHIHLKNKTHNWEQTSPNYQMHFTVHLTVWLATTGKKSSIGTNIILTAYWSPSKQLKTPRTQPILKRKLEHNALFKIHKCSH